MYIAQLIVCSMPLHLINPLFAIHSLRTHYTHTNFCCRAYSINCWLSFSRIQPILLGSLLTWYYFSHVLVGFSLTHGRWGAYISVEFLASHFFTNFAPSPIRNSLSPQASGRALTITNKKLHGRKCWKQLRLIDLDCSRILTGLVLLKRQW